MAEFNGHDVRVVKVKGEFTAAFIGINLTHRNMADAEIAHTLTDGVRNEVEAWQAR